MAGEAFWNAAADTPGVRVSQPELTVTDGAALTVSITHVWGITPDGDPYYNAAGVALGDEAELIITAGVPYLRPLES